MENVKEEDIAESLTPGVNGKHFIVFGGTGSIGSTTARLLCQGGAKVLITGRDQARLNQLEDELGIETCKFDVTEGNEIDQCFTSFLEKHERLDGVVNCVGSLVLKPAHLTTDEQWESTININLSSCFKILRAATSAMMRTGGSIVLVSSAAAQVGLASHEAIAAAKAGVIGLALSAAATYARRSIRINCVAPGLVLSQLTRDIVSNETNKKASEAMHALGRLGEPVDVANAIAWLLSSNSSWVTGQVLSIDGGLSMIRPKGH